MYACVYARISATIKTTHEYTAAPELMLVFWGHVPVLCGERKGLEEIQPILTFHLFCQ